MATWARKGSDRCANHPPSRLISPVLAVMTLLKRLDDWRHTLRLPAVIGVQA